MAKTSKKRKVRPLRTYSTEAILKAITELLDSMNAVVRYRGKLSPGQIAAGMNAAARNAGRLVKDAEILFEAKRYPSAAALAVLAIEEAGKLPILRALAVARSNDAIKDGWKSYCSHQTKNVLWLFPLYVLSGIRTLDGFSPLFDPDSKHRKRLDELKQGGFYTDCVGKAEWSEPEEFIDELVAAFVIKTARSLTKVYSFTEREIELWIEHVGPNLGEAKPENLKKFWSAMIDEGIAHSNDDVDTFLGLKSV
jgi:AbiV family abortive infection protein